MVLLAILNLTQNSPEALTPDGKPGWFVKRDGKSYLVSE